MVVCTLFEAPPGPARAGGGRILTVGVGGSAEETGRGPSRDRVAPSQIWDRNGCRRDEGCRREDRAGRLVAQPRRERAGARFVVFSLLPPAVFDGLTC